MVDFHNAGWLQRFNIQDSQFGSPSCDIGVSVYVIERDVEELVIMKAAGGSSGSITSSGTRSSSDEASGSTVTTANTPVEKNTIVLKDLH